MDSCQKEISSSWLALLALAPLLAMDAGCHGCPLRQQPTEAELQARALVERYQALVRDGDLDQAYAASCQDTFQQQIAPPRFRQAHAELVRQHGQLQGWEWRWTDLLTEPGRGELIRLRYAQDRERDRATQVTYEIRATPAGPCIDATYLYSVARKTLVPEVR